MQFVAAAESAILSVRTGARRRAGPEAKSYRADAARSANATSPAPDFETVPAAPFPTVVTRDASAAYVFPAAGDTAAPSVLLNDATDERSRTPRAPA